MSEYNMIDGYDPFLSGEPIEQRDVTPYGVHVSIAPAFWGDRYHRWFNAQ